MENYLIKILIAAELIITVLSMIILIITTEHKKVKKELQELKEIDKTRSLDIMSRYVATISGNVGLRDLDEETQTKIIRVAQRLTTQTILLRETLIDIEEKLFKNK